MTNAIKTCPYCDGRIELKDGKSYCPTQAVFVQSLTEAGYVPPGSANNKKDNTGNINTPKKSKTKTAMFKSTGALSNFSASHPLSIRNSKVVNKDNTVDIGEITLSGFISRIIAIAIDFVLLIPAYIYINQYHPSSLAINIQYNSDIGQLTTLELYNPYNILYFVLAVIAYFLVFEVLFSATPGKLIMSERIATRSGNTPKLSQKIFHSCLVPLDIFFGFFVFVISSKNQLFSDKIAGIIVVKKKPYGTSIYGEPVSGFRKFMGFIMFVSFVVFGYVIAQTIPKIQQINDYASVVVTEVKNISESGDASTFYDLFTEESKNNNNIEDLNSAFISPGMVLLIASLNPNAFRPYFYAFNDTEATVYGITDNDLYIEMTLLKNEANEWQLHIIDIHI